MLPRPCVVRRVRRETSDVVSLELSGAAAFSPGQFAMLYALGVGEVPISISGAGAGGLVHTVRRAGAATRALAGLRPGDALGWRGPFGAAWPLEAARGRDVLVMAGGLGLAPLRPALERLLERRSDYGRVRLLYGARSPADLLFRRDLARWRRALDVDVAVTVDRSAGRWRGAVGTVTALLAGARLEPERTAAFVCGPELMMRFCAAELEKLGLPAASVFVSLERNMRCAVGFCGHCQLGPAFVCKDGPVFSWDRLGPWLGARSL